MTDTSDLIFQWIGVAVIVVTSIIYAVRRFFLKKGGNTDCSGCELADRCNKKHEKHKSDCR